MREPRSENSWMHNSPLLMRGERVQRALIHVDDAAELQIADGDLVRVSSPFGEITVGVTATKDLMAGVIAVPHGWGHKGTGDMAAGQQGRRCERQPVDVERAQGCRVAVGHGVADRCPGARGTRLAVSQSASVRVCHLTRRGRHHNAHARDLTKVREMSAMRGVSRVQTRTAAAREIAQTAANCGVSLCRHARSRARVERV